jgi:peptidoglycan/LPS O-acetylase OafA/YrhL
VRGGDDTGSDHFRPDIEGLRAIAVVLVMLFHSGIPIFSGGYVGVDVFFVISGFLITGLLLREIERSGGADLGRFYARRIRRLLPATALVLAATAALTLLTLPATRWMSISRDIRWSALYAVNWRFAERAVDYLAADEAASPLQHFWSLSVEEQFYLVWPLLLLAASYLAVRRGWRLRPTLLLGLGAVGLTSFAWSVSLTGSEPGRAFFVSTTRVWELALGGCIAIVAPMIGRMPTRIAALLAIAGTGGILGAGLTFDELTAFPGSAAALPVVATALVIGAGISSSNTAVARILGLAQMRLIGAMSYSLYLWHWPLLVMADANWGPLSAWQGAAVVAISFVPAYLSYQYVERRWRYSDTFITPPQRGLRIGAILTVIGLGAGIAVAIALPDEPAAASAEIELAAPTTQPSAPPEATAPLTETIPPTEPPATTVTTAAPDPEPVEEIVVGPIQSDTVLQLVAGRLRPDPLNARDDLPAVYGEACHQNQRDPEVLSCTYGDAASPLRVAIVGDSHAAMWVPTLRLIAEQQQWQLRTITKSNCQLADVVIANGERQLPYENCVEWNNNVIEELLTTRPDLVLVTGRFWPTLVGEDGLVNGTARESALAAGLTRTWSAMAADGLTVVAIHDVPYPAVDVAECVSENRANLEACAMDRNDIMAENTPHAVAADQAEIGLVDLTGQICIDDVCPAVIDNILVWRDTHHLSATYARLLADALAEQLRELAPDMFLTSPSS